MRLYALAMAFALVSSPVWAASAPDQEKQTIAVSVRVSPHDLPPVIYSLLKNKIESGATDCRRSAIGASHLWHCFFPK